MRCWRCVWGQTVPPVCFQSGPRVHVRFHCATTCDFKEEKGNNLVSNVGWKETSNFPLVIQFLQAALRCSTFVYFPPLLTQAPPTFFLSALITSTLCLLIDYKKYLKLPLSLTLCLDKLAHSGTWQLVFAFTANSRNRKCCLPTGRRVYDCR